MYSDARKKGKKKGSSEQYQKYGNSKGDTWFEDKKGIVQAGGFRAKGGPKTW